MKQTMILVGLLLALAAATFGQVTPAPSPTAVKPTPPPPSTSKFKVGDMAPDFTLPDLTGAKVKLSDFRGKSNVVLAFYVFAFTGG
jgi:cytochrome oxidase Cu insertion factor (SCO1/SenC/PrrC family)